MRLDKRLTELYPEKSRSQLKKFIEKGAVFVNKKIVQKSKFEVEENDEIQVNFPEIQEREDLKPENIPLDIIFENDDFLVINKQKGISVHPGDDENPTGTIVNAVMYHCGNSLSGIGGERRPGIVHRLDKDTTGVLIIAKNDQFHAHLSKQIEERKVKKIYRALVCGHPQDGEIHASIGRSEKDRKKMTVKAGGREAFTRFKVIEYFPNDDVSLLEIELITGRTHQIRVHFSSIGHPVVGDELYGAEKMNKKFIQKFKEYSQILHAYCYSFKDIQGKEQSFEATLPELLDEKSEVLR